jgi:hypothetical protein
VAFGNDRFVIIGDISKVSTDGRSWSPVTLPFGGARSLAFGGGRFVTADSSGQVAWSADGAQWNLVSPQPSSSLIRAVSYGNGTFVLLEADGRAQTSPDGAQWTIRDVIAPNLINVTFAHDRFFATGMGQDLAGRIFTSGDGVAWQPLPPFGPGVQITGVIRFGERWLAWGEVAFSGLGTFNGFVVESDDLQTWTTVPVPTSVPITSLMSQPGGLLIAGRSATIMLSPDGGTVPLSPLLALPEIALESDFDATTRRLTLFGRQGQNVILQVSNGLGAWTTVETITLRNDTETVELIEPVPSDQRFFRLAAP